MTQAANGATRGEICAVAAAEAFRGNGEILASCFEPRETGLRSDLIQKFWPAK